MEAALSNPETSLERVSAVVRRVAAEEVMPRYLKVAHQRKSDGSLFTEADIAAQDTLSQLLPTSSEMPSPSSSHSQASPVPSPSVSC